MKKIIVLLFVILSLSVIANYVSKRVYSKNDAREEISQDWAVFQHDLKQSGYAPVSLSTSTLRLKWKKEILIDAPYQTTPSIANGIVYITGKNKFCALALADGTPVYEVSLPTQTSLGGARGTPAIKDNRICVVKGELFSHSQGWKGYVYGMDLEGRVAWTYGDASAFNESPIIADNRVYVYDIRGTLYALSAKNGKLLWKYETDDYGGSTPVIVGNKIFMGAKDNGRLYCLDKKGNVLWFSDQESAHNSVVASEERIYGCGRKGLSCFNGYGRVLWTRKDVADPRANLALKRDDLYVVSRGVIYCLDAMHGNMRWQSSINKYSGISQVAVTDNVLFVGVDNGLLVALDANTGTELWKYGTGGIASSPAITKHYIVTVAKNNEHQYPLPAGVWSYVYCFEDAGEPLDTTREIEIAGRVVDDRGTPLSGAHVYAVGAETKTNAEGNYTMRIRGYAGGDTLVFAGFSDEIKNGHWGGSGIAYCAPGKKTIIDITSTFEEYGGD